jgi:hypothetical protein
VILLGLGDLFTRVSRAHSSALPSIPNHQVLLAPTAMKPVSRAHSAAAPSLPNHQVLLAPTAMKPVSRTHSFAVLSPPNHQVLLAPTAMKPVSSSFHSYMGQYSPVLLKCRHPHSSKQSSYIRPSLASSCLSCLVFVDFFFPAVAMLINFKILICVTFSL